jgi:hypothetical protein
MRHVRLVCELHKKNMTEVKKLTCLSINFAHITQKNKKQKNRGREEKKSKDKVK